MARTIKQIQSEIVENLTASLSSLSRSSVAEWRLWTYIVALAIHSFEVIMDVFRYQIESKIQQTRPGTLNWYTYMCYQFQNGHTLILKDGILNYPMDDPSSRIISMASVTPVNGALVFRVAKSSTGLLTPLSADEKGNFSNYIEAIAMAGVKFSVVSKEADSVRYSIDIYYDPAFPQSTVHESVKAGLAAFNTNTDFGGVIYSQRLIDYIIDVQGVVTAKLVKLEHKSVTAADYTLVDISATLDAGYYNFANDSTLTLKTIKELQL